MIVIQNVVSKPLKFGFIYNLLIYLFLWVVLGQLTLELFEGEGAGNPSSACGPERGRIGVQECRSAGVQEYRSTGVQEYRTGSLLLLSPHLCSLHTLQWTLINLKVRIILIVSKCKFTLGITFLHFFMPHLFYLNRSSISTQLWLLINKIYPVLKGCKVWAAVCLVKSILMVPLPVLHLLNTLTGDRNTLTNTCSLYGRNKVLLLCQGESVRATCSRARP